MTRRHNATIATKALEPIRACFAPSRLRAFVIVMGAFWLAQASASAEPLRLHPKNPHYFLHRGKPTVLVTSGSFVVNPSIYRKLPYDTVKDFAPVSQLTEGEAHIIVVNPSLSVRTVKELVALAA